MIDAVWRVVVAAVWRPVAWDVHLTRPYWLGRTGAGFRSITGRYVRV